MLRTMQKVGWKGTLTTFFLESASYKHLFFRWVRPLQLTINSWFWIIYFVLGHQASSHNFLSVIFGILRKFRIGICGRNFFRRFFWSKKFDRKNSFQKKIGEKISIENFENQNFENFKISIFFSRKFRRFFYSNIFKILIFKNVRSIFFRQFFFCKIFSDLYTSGQPQKMWTWWPQATP